MKLLLNPGTTCWRVEKASRVAVLIDAAEYYAAAKAAMSKAQRSVHLLNWAFEPETSLIPGSDGGSVAADKAGQFLKDLADARPELDVRLLCWRSTLPVAVTQRFFPIKARLCFAGSRVKFRLDDVAPWGGCHHQKMIIIDDAVAFCGGADIGPDRWDTPAHPDDDPRRKKTPKSKKTFDSRHEVMAVMDGDAAAALGQLFRDRWQRCTKVLLGTGEPLPPIAWPASVTPDFQDVRVGISRTTAKWRRQAEIRENEALYLASIAAARHTIYLENQYLTSPVIAEALAERLEVPKGPEVILVSTGQSASYFDEVTMDRTRTLFLKRLQGADHHGRLRAYSPVTSLGRLIIVHAKLAIIDDGLLRVGSTNLNNRSAGFDTECDITVEASGKNAAAARTRIAEIRTRLLAHWLGCDSQVILDAVAVAGSIGKGLEALRGQGLCRLRPIETKPLGPLALFIAAFHIGDPASTRDSWRPWIRRNILRADLKRFKAMAVEKAS